MNKEGALKRIESFKGLEKNWDSYNGLPIHPAAIDRAKELLEGLFISPVSDGNIAITLGDEDITIMIDDQGGASVVLI